MKLYSDPNRIMLKEIKNTIKSNRIKLHECVEYNVLETIWDNNLNGIKHVVANITEDLAEELKSKIAFLTLRG